jgi:hypothetical protein
MAEEVDELFGGAGEPRPRVGRVAALILSGLLLAILGLACTSVPGILVLLLAWSAAGVEEERVESGYLPKTSAAQVHALRRISTTALMLGAVLLVVQLVLLNRGFYQDKWEAALQWLLQRM